VKTAFRGCRITISEVCSKRWQDLAPTAVDTIRFCGSCSKEIFLCQGEAQGEYHARMGRCIALVVPNDVGGSQSAVEPLMVIGEANSAYSDE